MPYCRNNNCNTSSAKTKCGPKAKDNGCGSVQLDERYLDIEVVKGTTFTLEFCSINVDISSILEIQPSATEAQITFAADHCFTVGDKIRLYDHEPRCQAWSLNDIHTVASVVDTRTITIDAPFFDPQPQSFTSPTSFVTGCNKEVTCVPQAVKLNDLTGYSFFGKIMNRFETERVSVNLKAQLDSGSPLVRVEPAGRVVAGDLVTISGTDIVDIQVLNVIREAGYDIIELEMVSNVTSECSPMATKPGCLSRFKFDTTDAECGCIVAYIECNTSELEQPVGSGTLVEYAGTNDIPLVGSRSNGCDCGDVGYDIGYYDIIAVAPDSAGATYTNKQVLLRGKVKLVPTVSGSLL